jgi:ssDNA-binding Zn-finger/Zn-ribbon topoisomerase 1
VNRLAENCPVCNKSDIPLKRNNHGGIFYDCDVCGRYTITYNAKSILKRIKVEDSRREKLSEFIQTHQNDEGPIDDRPLIDVNKLEFFDIK